MPFIKKLLEKTQEHISSLPNTFTESIKSGEKFEQIVLETMIMMQSSDQDLEANITSIEGTGKLAFPDIIIKLPNGEIHGVEVKFSGSGKWDSLGNSIFESTSIQDIQDIYLLFGRKYSEGIEVKFDFYANCINDVKVTHSPRFTINMNKTNSFFTELGTPYSEFKREDKIEKGKIVKDFYKKQLKPGEEVWWIDPKTTPISPKLKFFSTLSHVEQDELILEAFILFPAVFSHSGRTKYSGVGTYWLTKYQIYNHALRDGFSSSGKLKICFPEYGLVEVSRVYGKLFSQAKDIERKLLNPDEDFFNLCIDKWTDFTGSLLVVTDNLLDTWMNLIDSVGIPPNRDHDLKPSDIFKAGLLREE